VKAASVHLDVKPAFRRNEAARLPRSRLAGISALDLWIVRLNHRQEPLAGQKGRLWEFCGKHHVANSEQNEQMKKRPSVRANHV